MEETPLVAREQGYVSSIYGRRRQIPSIKDRNFNVRHRAEREAINMPIQGTASDIVKIAMLKLMTLCAAKVENAMIMQVHDELLLESPEAEVEKAMEIVRREMESAVEIDVPLLVEVGAGDNWMNAK
jgi:DNA polymerase-1